MSLSAEIRRSITRDEKRSETRYGTRVAVRVDETAHGRLEDTARAEPERVHLDRLVDVVEELGEGVDRDEQVLIDVLVHVHLMEVTVGRELEEADLGREQPAERVAEEPSVAKGEDVLHLPEERAGVAVVVGAQGDVLDKLGCLGRAKRALLSSGLGLIQEGLDVLVEPGAIPTQVQSNESQDKTISILRRTTCQYHAQRHRYQPCQQSCNS